MGSPPLLPLRLAGTLTEAAGGTALTAVVVGHMQRASCPTHIRCFLISLCIKSQVILHFPGATHATLPVPSAPSAELHCRVDVSGCECLQIDEKSRPLRQGPVF